MTGEGAVSPPAPDIERFQQRSRNAVLNSDNVFCVFGASFQENVNTRILFLKTS